MTMQGKTLMETQISEAERTAESYAKRALKEAIAAIKSLLKKDGYSISHIPEKPGTLSGMTDALTDILEGKNLRLWKKSLKYRIC